MVNGPSDGTGRAKAADGKEGADCRADSQPLGFGSPCLGGLSGLVGIGCGCGRGGTDPLGGFDPGGVVGMCPPGSTTGGFVPNGVTGPGWISVVAGLLPAGGAG